MKEFSAKEAGDKVSTLAKFLVKTYDELISINQREAELYERWNNLADRNPDLYRQEFQEKKEEFINGAFALRHERDQRWSDLGIPPDRALVLLVDLKHVDEKGKAGLAITKAQKQALLDLANEHFPEFKDGTPRDKWTEPAKFAYTYFEYFEGRKCVDE